MEFLGHTVGDHFCIIFIVGFLIACAVFSRGSKGGKQ